MYTEKVFFEEDHLVSYEALNIFHYNLHCHEEVTEVLLLTKGSANVKVSFENFMMREGDFIVINKEDSHSIYPQSSGCNVVSLYFNMSKLVDHIPHCGYVVFACESFDLAKYKNDVQRLRKIICEMSISLIEKDAKDKINEMAIEFMKTLINNYDMKNYYSRNWEAGFSKIQKYYKIMMYINLNYHRNNLAEYIANKEFYSKSYITHLFKEVSANSFQDVLTYFRLYKSERMLLDSEDTIGNISDKIGFSDTKYYTRNFKKWFGCNPSEYRRLYKPEVLRGSNYKLIPSDDLILMIRECLNMEDDNSKYKGATTPLNTSAKDHFEKIVKTGEQGFTGNNGLKDDGILVEINHRTDLKTLATEYNILIKSDISCNFLIYYRDMNALQLRELLIRCSDILVLAVGDALPLEVNAVKVMIMYYSVRERETIIEAVKESEQKMRNLNISTTMVVSM